MRNLLRTGMWWEPLVACATLRAARLWSKVPLCFARREIIFGFRVREATLHGFLLPYFSAIIDGSRGEGGLASLSLLREVLDRSHDQSVRRHRAFGTRLSVRLTTDHSHDHS